MRRNIMAEIGRNGYTNNGVCKKLSISVPTLKRYINGGSIPSDKLKAMSVLFSRSIDYLLEDYK